jgi:hypothetical protein
VVNIQELALGDVPKAPTYWKLKTTSCADKFPAVVMTQTSERTIVLALALGRPPLVGTKYLLSNNEATCGQPELGAKKLKAKCWYGAETRTCTFEYGQPAPTPHR